MQVQTDIARKLLEVTEKTGYPIVQHNGQRKFGPPPDWTGPPPPRGCEVFIGKLPREIYEDDLVPIFSQVGKIYELRLMMDFSGSNRGYAFVTYASKADAAKAVTKLNNYEIRPYRRIGVVKSVDNCRLYIGNLPKSKTKEEVLEELSKRVAGIVDVVLYRNCYDRQQNRGFAFVEFTSHRAAAMARRTLIPGCVKLWDKDILVDWAEPEPDVDEDVMKIVKVLHARNFTVETPPDTIKKIFESTIRTKVERVKKFYDYAFIHFYEREHAERAMAKLQNAEIDGSRIEIKWARPVHRDLYHMQKRRRGNAKFNSLDLIQTMMLYEQHLEKREYASSPRDEGFGSTCAPGSQCCSPAEYAVCPQENYTPAPATLESMCSRYMWAQPIYKYKKYLDHNYRELWIAVLDLPHVGQPLFNTPQSFGPFITKTCYSPQHAQIEAATIALQTLNMPRVEPIQQSTAGPQLYQPLLPTVPPTCLNGPYDYMNPIPYARPMPLAIPTMW